MDAAQWPQGNIGVVKPMESSSRRPRPEKEQALNCPRCNSTNTKFCYYNNYSLTQPRYFCKGCRRYWTQGGSLRNVPVGGGSRKNKRSSSSSSPSPSSLKKVATPNNFPQNHEGQDLTLAYPPSSGNYNNSNPTPFELLKTGFASIYSSGFQHMQEFKPALNFSVGGFDGGYNGNLQGVGHETSGARLFFPFEELKQQQPSTANGEPSGYWSGMLGGGGSWQV